MKTIVVGKKTSITSTYLCTFKEFTIGIHARSLSAATQKAVEYFKPKKKELDLLDVQFYGAKIHDSQR
jgi:hypothetical protein